MIKIVGIVSVFICKKNTFGFLLTTSNPFMHQQIVHIALVVKDYDEAIAFYTQKLNFDLLEDTVMSETKRWVLVAPKGSFGTALLLAKGVGEAQQSRIGNQTGGRVFLFLKTDDFDRDYKSMSEKGIRFVREPQEQDYGKVAVFEDLYGNLWDLIESK
jgi:catechol 2,3-dioxygenase-like lactoylglutathione lyase family enzyme